MKKRQSKNLDLSKFKIIQTVAENVKRYRLELDISQETLAEYADLHRNSVSLLEKGELNFTITTLENIAKALKTTAIDLLNEVKS